MIGPYSGKILHFDEITLKAGGVAYVYFAEWKGNDTPVEMAIDSNGGGQIDETYSSTDKN
jgi:hypothetical protein